MTRCHAYSNLLLLLMSYVRYLLGHLCLDIYAGTLEGKEQLCFSKNYFEPDPGQLFSYTSHSGLSCLWSSQRSYLATHCLPHEIVASNVSYWTQPEISFVKINCDAAFQPRALECNVGLFACDHL